MTETCWESIETTTEELMATETVILNDTSCFVDSRSCGSSSDHHALWDELGLSEARSSPEECQMVCQWKGDHIHDDILQLFIVSLIFHRWMQLL